MEPLLWAPSFSPSNSSTSFYVGIWYNSVPERTVVWVANRDNSITSPYSVTLAVTNRSDLVLSDPGGRIYWSTKNSITTVGIGASAVLLNEGNLVLRSSDGTVLWQSFDHPTDTILPGMPFRVVNYRTRFAERLVSWKGPQDPSSGNFSFSGGVSSGIQLFIWNGSSPSWRSTAWDGEMVGSYKPSAYASSVIITTIVANGDEISLTYSVVSGDGPPAPGTHARMSYTGRFEFRIWNSSASAWTILEANPRPGCEHYAACGPFGYCDATEAVPTCKCPDGFEPANGTRPSGGCARKTPLRCGGEEGGHFAILQGMKTPATAVFLRNRSLLWGRRSLRGLQRTSRGQENCSQQQEQPTRNPAPRYIRASRDPFKTSSIEYKQTTYKM
ncbi:hypothetical protein SETIT_7G251800v2 [Setaria italica]|uniref:non-specific serine/threonine protein kinase n=1 Tax=Setaria italica TaxID=4555 RepID=A0A368S177_SETIT|nr:hypothetical protein SETIT_7G251800v2 [Setaria italica]